MKRVHASGPIRRWGVFIRDRFAPARCLPMATAFFAGNALLAGRLTESTLPVGAGLCGLLATVLVFFRLRIFDDIKDATRDREEHADRPLARGLITLSEARRAAVIVAALELVLAALVGWRAVAAWSVVLVYSVLMYREFFVGEWMRPKMELYAVTHTLVAGWLGLFVASVATSRAPWELPAAVWALAAVNWAVFNVFEFARKSWGLEEERSGIASYSGRLGPTGAAALTLSQALPAVALVAWLLAASTARAAAVVAPLILAGVGLAAAIAYARAPSRTPARRYRASMTLFILGIYVITAILSAQEG